MILPDGRTFAYSKLGATAAAAGFLYQGGAKNANAKWDGTIAVSTNGAVSDTTVYTMLASTVLAANVFEDGFLFTASSVGTGIGYSYKIKSHNGFAVTTGVVAFKLYENDAVKVAMQAGTTTVGARQNPYNNCLLTTADTARVGPLAGVACCTAAASTYVWLQTKGPAAVRTDGTLIVGLPVVAASIGCVAVVAGTASAGSVPAWEIIGTCMSVAASLQFSLIKLDLQG